MLLLAVAARQELEAALCWRESEPSASLPVGSGLSPQAAAMPEHEAVPCTVHGRHVLACLTGVGPVNAGTALGRVLALRPDISAVLNVGLAGSFDLARAPLGSVWRVEREIWPEYGLLGGASDAEAGAADAATAGADAPALGFPLWQGPHGPVWDSVDLPDAAQWARAAGLTETACAGQAASAQQSGAGQALFGLPGGVSLSVAGVTNDARRAAALHARYGALLENMEGFAIALACVRRGIPLLEARTVSNLAGSRAPEHRAFGPALAGLGALVHNLLAHKGGQNV